MSHVREGKQAQKAQAVVTTDNFDKDFSKHITPGFTIDVEAGEVSEASSFASAIDGLTEKSTGTRQKCLLNIAALLQYREIHEWELDERCKLTISQPLQFSIYLQIICPTEWNHSPKELKNH